jgi:exodeoxyribonuclease V beta subunit
VLADEHPPAVPAAPPDAAADEDLLAVTSPLAGMPAGVRVGTFVHRLLQVADFASPDLDAELLSHVVAARSPGEIGDPAVVAGGLAAALRTPLGPLLGGRRLCDVARADRLDELGFELPLAGGDAPGGDGLALDAIGTLLREHLPAGDPLAGYAERLSDPALSRGARGYLTGSIDLVLRDGERFAVVDYKTNWLAGPGEELTAWHHRPAALVAEMERYHYGLQALLYTVALHRYLRWRLHSYDPERHLAGVLYLFLRGMSGPGTPVVGGDTCGVFAWKPPPGLVAQLSDVLDRGGAP